MICDLCKCDIIFNKDRCLRLNDFNQGLQESERWYHLECFKKGMNRDLTDLEKKAKSILDQAPQILGMLGIKEKPTEYIIK